MKRPQILLNRISDVGRLLVDGGSAGIYLSNHDAPTEDRTGAAAEEFVDLPALDFRLRSAKCPAVDAGIVLKGINDEVVDGKPDLGAYEYGRPPWQAGATVTPHQP